MIILRLIVRETVEWDFILINLKINMVSLFLLILFYLYKVNASPYLLNDGCPERNPEYSGDDTCSADWILAMCPRCNTDCPPSPAPTCSVRGCTDEPTNSPSTSPTRTVPVGNPTAYPTFITTVINKLTSEPSTFPSLIPTSQPITSSPTVSPSTSPSDSPSESPSDAPSDSPSTYPTWIATSKDRCPLSVYVEN